MLMIDEEVEEPSENKIKIVDGNLLSYVKTHIVHQCNTITDKGKGIAETIFKKFPDDDAINLVGQHYPGVAKYANDTAEKRIAAFKKGLETIARKIPSDNIGC